MIVDQAMYNHPTAEQLQQYSDRTLPPDAFDVIHRHVISCAVCFEKCDASSETSQDYENLLTALLPNPYDDPYHLSYEQLAAYVDGELVEPDLQSAGSHLEVCAQCRDDVRNLQEFKAESLAASASQPLKKKTPAASFNLPRRYWPARENLKSAAAMVVAIGVIILLALIFFQSKSPIPAEQAERPGDSNTANHQGPPRPDSRSDEQTKPVEQAKPGDQGKQDNLPGASPPLPEGPAGPHETLQPLLALNDGGSKITLDQNGMLTGLENLPESLRQAVKSALTTQMVQRPRILTELNGKSSTLLSESSGDIPFKLLSPVGVVIQSGRPTFRWLPLKGASGYRVTVTDADLNEVAISQLLTASEWKLPEALKPGAIYSWQVTAIKDGQEVTSPVLPAPQAKFKVLEQTEAEELKSARQASPRSHLVMGVMYARAGLLAESEQELRLLVKANPESRLAQNLLRSVRKLKRDMASRADLPPRL